MDFEAADQILWGQLLQSTFSKMDTLIGQKIIHLMEVSVLQRVGLYGNNDSIAW